MTWLYPMSCNVTTVFTRTKVITLLSQLWLYIQFCTMWYLLNTIGHGASY